MRADSIDVDGVIGRSRERGRAAAAKPVAVGRRDRVRGELVERVREARKRLARRAGVARRSHKPQKP